MKLSYSATLKEGDLHISGYKQLLAEIQAEGWTDLIVTVEKRGRKRSTLANRYYFGVVVTLIHAGLKDMGHRLSKEETHEFLKARFNYKELINEDTGEIAKLPASTATLTVSGFMDYIAQCKQFAAEWLGVDIPSAGEQINIEH